MIGPRSGSHRTKWNELGFNRPICQRTPYSTRLVERCLGCALSIGSFGSRSQTGFGDTGPSFVWGTTHADPSNLTHRLLQSGAGLPMTDTEKRVPINPEATYAVTSSYSRAISVLAWLIPIVLFLGIAVRAWRIGGLSAVPLDVVRFFDLDTHEAVTASSRKLPAFNFQYIGLGIGVFSSAWVNAKQAPTLRLSRVCGHLLFSLILGAIFFSPLFDALSCSAAQAHGYVGILAAGFTLGFSLDDIGHKIIYLGKALGTHDDATAK